MSKIAVVYWSGTGNTERMASKIVEGVREAGGNAVLYTAAQFGRSLIKDYDVVVFGCPSMGAEQLEESEFAPMFENCLPELSGRKIALFGSYGWGDGEWMRIWEEECVSRGALLAHSSVICREAPDGEAKSQCIEMGRALVS